MAARISKKKEAEFISEPPKQDLVKTEDAPPVLSVEPPKAEESVKPEEEKKEEEVVSTDNIVSPEAPVAADDLPPVESTPPPPVPTISVPLPEAPKKGPAWFIIIALVAVIAIALGIWYYYGKNKSAGKKGDILILLSPTAGASEPTPTTEAGVKLDKYPIKVLNGSGIEGEAGKVKTVLEEEGFKVSSTGNADNYDYKETVIQVKKGLEKSFLDKLKSTLKATYKLGEDEELSASDEGDVIIIVGSEKSE